MSLCHFTFLVFIKIYFTYSRNSDFCVLIFNKCLQICNLCLSRTENRAITLPEFLHSAPWESNLLPSQLVSFTQHNAIDFHLYCYMYNSSLLILLSSIAWYRCATVCLTSLQLKDIYLGCFQLGTIINKTPISIYI